MHIKNNKVWVKYSLAERIIGTIFILLTALMIRLTIHSYVEPYAPFHFFIVACLLIVILFGYWPALIGVLISIILGGYFFMRPYNDFGTLATTDWLEFFNFSSVTVITIFIIEQLQRSIYAQNLLLKVLESRHYVMLLNENERVFFERNNNSARSAFEEFLANIDNIVLLKYGDSDINVHPLFLKITQTKTNSSIENDWQSTVHPDDLQVLLTKMDNSKDADNLSDQIQIRLLKNGVFSQYTLHIEKFLLARQRVTALRYLKYQNST